MLSMGAVLGGQYEVDGKWLGGTMCSLTHAHIYTCCGRETGAEKRTQGKSAALSESALTIYHAVTAAAAASRHRGQERSGL